MEAELGVCSNGISEPDFLGWEIKQFAVKNFEKFGATPISLMDHSPNKGYFAENGVEAFIRKYGYEDKNGKEARLNFGGIHKHDIINKLTNLKLITDGFNATTKKIENVDGFIGLIDNKENLAASCSFASLIKHWNRKHSNACYVPSKKRVDEELFPFSGQQYCYGNKVILGITTDVTLFLEQVCLGNIYFDPGLKLELAIEGVRTQKTKTRSLFRIKSNSLASLYKINEVVDVKD